MSLVLEYRNMRADFLALHELLLWDAYRSARAAHYWSIGFWSCVLLLGGYAAFRADQLFLMCLMIAIGGWTLVRSFPYSRAYWTAVEQSLSGRPETQITLEVQEDGLHETLDGIESFVPWSAVKSFTVYRDTLFIELAASLWAIIPRSSVSLGSTAVDDLIRILREKGIAESPNQMVQRAGASRFAQSAIQTSSAAGSRR